MNLAIARSILSVVSLLFVAWVMPMPSQAATVNATLTVQNGPYHSTWRQRGASNTWDAVWTGHSTITTVMEGSIQGNQVLMRRTASSDGYFCEYRGSIAPNGVDVSGTQVCPGLTPSSWSGRLGTSGGEAVVLPSLTGAWVHSADPSVQPPDSRVILVQEGPRVTLTHAYKARGRWLTLVCQGTLAGQALRLPCAWAEGGNPFGFAAPTLDLKVSPDGNRLDGVLTAAGAGSQESHYSRLP